MTDHPCLAGLPLVLGGNVFGWTADEAASFAVLDRFYEGGGRMIDTAQGYSDWVPGHQGGESETMIGRWLAKSGVRAEMRIGTKTGMHGETGDLRPERVAAELDRSLERLGTDYIDLYYAHRDDTATPQDEVAAGFDALVESGVVRETGASNFTLARLASLNEAAHRAGTRRFTVLQNEYNLVSRDEYGADLQAYCLTHGIAMLPFYGLASGFLTGKYRERSDLAGQARGGGIGPLLERGRPVLDAMDAVAAETGAALGSIALAWLAAQPGIAAPIASARTPAQLDIQFEAATLELSPDQLSRLTAAGL
ncbi:aldo/keto reductase [Croceibacterium sp. TMG7-5b_MA50]|uniref:aldo/keto reductase n=1 Tax=Croceibacterium sp. TMG7-5b_MA50 TaxID=3121290 RepID=UPI0032219F1F